MKPFIKILYKTKDTFNYLDNQYADELDLNCNAIFIIVGAISGFESFFLEFEHFRNQLNIGIIILLWILVVVFGAGFSVLVGRYLMTYLLYGIGRLMKGAAEVIDIRVVFAYSLIPVFFRLPIDIYLGLSHKLSNASVTDHWIINSIYIVIGIWALKILIQGIIRFNKFGLVKALINISPFLIFNFAYYITYYLINT